MQLLQVLWGFVLGYDRYVSFGLAQVQTQQEPCMIFSLHHDNCKTLSSSATKQSGSERFVGVLKQGGHLTHGCLLCSSARHCFTRVSRKIPWQMQFAESFPKAVGTIHIEPSLNTVPKNPEGLWSPAFRNLHARWMEEILHYPVIPKRYTTCWKLSGARFPPSTVILSS